MTVEAKSVVIATGCRERSPNQVAIHGSRPAGIMTAGSAQYYANIMGQLPSKYPIFFGSGNIGVVMARRLTLEGAKVLGIYETKDKPQSSVRNIAECLNDFNIPLHFSHTITHATGTHRLRSVVISRVDKNLTPIRGSENQVKCDSLIISAGLIPETGLIESLGIPLSSETGGPECDHNYMSMLDGVFVCGNAMYINDVVDYISESGEIAGRSAARYMARERRLATLTTSKDFLYCVPHYLDIDMLHNDTVIYFRSREIRENSVVKVYVDGFEAFSQEFPALRPPEIERIAVSFSTALSAESKVELRMESSR